MGNENTIYHINASDYSQHFYNAQQVYANVLPIPLDNYSGLQI